MTTYCYICCSYCKGHNKCKAKDGGCEHCDYWKYGECTHPKRP